MQVELQRMAKEAMERLDSTRADSFTTEENNYECEKCQDTEWIISKEDNSAKPCSCREIKRQKRILEQSGIAEGFKSKTFEKYNPWNEQLAKGKNMAMSYVYNYNEIRSTPNNSIALLGQVGSGKTHLIISIGNELMKNGIAVKYMEYRKAITEIKQSATDQENYTRLLNQYKNTDVLIIDDLFKSAITRNDFTGVERINPADERAMFEIINHRYFNQKPIIISSELSVNRLTRLDEGLVSRIIEMCKGHIFEFEGKELNYRLHG